MSMQEMARLILGLRAAGWGEKAINDFMLFIESGEEQYKPDPEKINGGAIKEQQFIEKIYRE